MTTGSGVSGRDGGLNLQEYGPAVRRWEIMSGVSAPYPAALGPQGGIKPAPEFVEWMKETRGPDALEPHRIKYKPLVRS